MVLITNDFCAEICLSFGLGNFIEKEPVTVGYEDHNMIFRTTLGTFFVKVFRRTVENATQLINSIRKAINLGVSHPDIYLPPVGGLGDINGTMVSVQEYLEGKTFYDLGRKPNIQEIKLIARQVALIHQIDIKLVPEYNQWAIINFENEYLTKKLFLDDEDYFLIHNLYEKFKKVDISKLPHSFVHGDIISTNVMIDQADQIRIIDFGTSGYYPRIFDLAVIMCNLCLVENTLKSQERAMILVEEYQKHAELTQAEIELLPIFSGIANALHVIGVTHFTKTNQAINSAENEYWVSQGRLGLKQLSEIRGHQ